MGPDKRDLKQAIFAGFVATAILAVFMYIAPLAGLPRIDLAAALGRPISGHPAVPLSGSWWLGMAIFFLFGGVLSPYVFALSYSGLLGSSWARGVEWGMVVWIFGGVAVMTAMGLGFDEAHFAHPFASFFSSLAGHLVYGAILGGLAGRVLMHLQQEKQQGPARA